MSPESDEPRQTSDATASQDAPVAHGGAAYPYGPVPTPAPAAPEMDIRAEDDEEAGEDVAIDDAFRQVLDRLYAQHGFDFHEYKERSLARRVHVRMRQAKIETAAAYVGYLDRHPEEYQALINTILINVTRFFRDPEAWEVIRSTVIPRILEEAGEEGAIRIWCAGCSTGEEPFTVAILLYEALGDRARSHDVKIYATDVDVGALNAARTGLFRLESLRDLPAKYLDKYFTQERPQLYRLQRDIRKWVIFGQHNLVQDPPIAHVDLLICRNVLIYFDSELQERILPRFHYALRERGFLFLGKAESLLARSKRFAPVDAKWRIFERVPHLAERPGRSPFALPLTAPIHAPFRQPRVDAAETTGLRSILNALPMGVLVVDASDTITLFNPVAEQLFDMPADATVGKKFRDLSISYRIDGLRARMEEAKSKRGTARLDSVLVTRASGEAAYATLTISPLFDERSRVAAVVVCAQDVSESVRLKEEMNRLGEEYATATEELQSTNEELETTNEELQSTNEELETTNEELQSTNEELETTNEELQSTNGELGHLNGELEARTRELRDANARYQGVLSALDQGVVVLDKALVVTSWNRTAARIFRLSAENAVGRELYSLPLRPAVPQLVGVITRALSNRRRETEAGVSCEPTNEVMSLMDVVVTPQIDEQGGLVGLVMSLTPHPVDGA